jgi:hypothetical protein
VKNKWQHGFTGIEIIIAIVAITLIAGGGYFIFKDAIGKPAPKEEVKKEEQKEVKNPFPSKPEEKIEPTTVENSTLPEDEGKPVISNITATGSWHGQFTVTSPDKCKGQSGGWEANLTETNGAISGSYSADGGYGGQVNGRRSGVGVNWSIGGGGEVSFNGSISGHTMSGSFTGEVCDEESNERAKGTFFGGRIVN